MGVPGQAGRRHLLPAVYVITDHLSDDELRCLYKAADAFVLPSRRAPTCGRAPAFVTTDDCGLLTLPNSPLRGGVHHVVPFRIPVCDIYAIAWSESLYDYTTSLQRSIGTQRSCRCAGARGGGAHMLRQWRWVSRVRNC